MGTWFRRTIPRVVLSFSLVFMVCGCAPAGPPSSPRGDQPEHGPRSATGAAKSASDFAGDDKGVDVEPVLQARNARCRALLVGVNDYEKLNDLRFCEQDVKALRDRLVAIGFEPEAIKCLTTGDAESDWRPSRRNIIERLDALFAGLDAESVLVIALSGHGGSFDFQDASGHNRKESFYCPKDARIHDPAGTMVSIRSIYDRLERCPARFKLLLVDACRDPHFVPSDTALAGHSAVDEAKSMAGFAKSLSDGRLPKATVALVSCTSGEQSWEDAGLKHGIFMHYVLEALAGEADKAYRGDGNGFVSYSELKDYVYRETSDHVWKVHGGASQTPVFYDNWELRNFDLVKLDTRPQRPQVPKVITNSIGMKLVLIPAGEFMMGSAESAEALAKEYDTKAEYFEGEHPQHRVRITKPFYLGVYEVTQAEYERVMGENPSEFKGATRPVETVSWDDAVEFCRKLSAQEGRTYRLPTEAEWEYACRAGTGTRFYWGQSDAELYRYGNYCDASNTNDLSWQDKDHDDGHDKTAPVGSYRANAWGLYDMSGNVYEWCQDWYDEDYYANSPTDDPQCSSSGSLRVSRGGSWFNYAGNCRSADRYSNLPGGGSSNLGFRLVLVPAD